MPLPNISNKNSNTLRELINGNSQNNMNLMDMRRVLGTLNLNNGGSESFFMGKAFKDMSTFFMDMIKKINDNLEKMANQLKETHGLQEDAKKEDDFWEDHREEEEKKREKEKLGFFKKMVKSLTGMELLTKENLKRAGMGIGGFLGMKAGAGLLGGMGGLAAAAISPFAAYGLIKGAMNAEEITGMKDLSGAGGAGHIMMAGVSQMISTLTMGYKDAPSIYRKIAPFLTDLMTQLGDVIGVKIPEALGKFVEKLKTDKTFGTFFTHVFGAASHMKTTIGKFFGDVLYPYIIEPLVDAIYTIEDRLKILTRISDAVDVVLDFYGISAKPTGEYGIASLYDPETVKRIRQLEKMRKDREQERRDLIRHQRFGMGIFDYGYNQNLIEHLTDDINSTQQRIDALKSEPRRRPGEGLHSGRVELKSIQGSSSSLGDYQSAFVSPLGSRLQQLTEGMPETGGGNCALEFRKTGEKLGLWKAEGGRGHAWQWAKNLEDMGFTEITGLSDEEIKNLPPGYGVVIDKGDREHGHVFYTLGGGKEMSDYVGNIESSLERHPTAQRRVFKLDTTSGGDQLNQMIKSGLSSSQNGYDQMQVVQPIINNNSHQAVIQPVDMKTSPLDSHSLVLLMSGKTSFS